MSQLSEEQLQQIVETPAGERIRMKCGAADLRSVITDALSLLDSDSQVAEGIPDDLPYRIVEAMGLGLTFRSCSCGQLPCARLRPLRDALETVRRDTTTAMRDQCVEKMKTLRDEADALIERATRHSNTRRRASITFQAYVKAVAALESLTLDQVKPGEK